MTIHVNGIDLFYDRTGEGWLFGRARISAPPPLSWAIFSAIPLRRPPPRGWSPCPAWSGVWEIFWRT